VNACSTSKVAVTSTRDVGRRAAADAVLGWLMDASTPRETVGIPLTLGNMGHIFAPVNPIL
jgi:hypothetical protein